MIVGVFYTIQNDTYGIFSNAEEMLIILKWGKETRLKLEAHHDGHLGKLRKHRKKDRIFTNHLICNVLYARHVSSFSLFCCKLSKLL